MNKWSYKLGSAEIVLKISSTRSTFCCQSLPAPEYTACQLRQRRSLIIPVFFFIVLDGNPLRYLVKAFPNDSTGRFASVFMSFAFIHSFHSSGIWLNERSVRSDLASRISVRSHRAARAFHSAPEDSQEGLESPTSSRRCWSGAGTLASPRGLEESVSCWVRTNDDRLYIPSFTQVVRTFLTTASYDVLVSDRIIPFGPLLFNNARSLFHRGSCQSLRE
jgi:hypothetical protein